MHAARKADRADRPDRADSADGTGGTDRPDRARPSDPSTHTERWVALLGNPNTGKTTIFNALTGVWARTGNYPGVTVDKKVGTLRASAGSASRPVRVLDLPGTYSLSARSPGMAHRWGGSYLPCDQRP